MFQDQGLQHGGKLFGVFDLVAFLRFNMGECINWAAYLGAASRFAGLDTYLRAGCLGVRQTHCITIRVMSFRIVSSRRRLTGRNVRKLAQT